MRLPLVAAMALTCLACSSDSPSGPSGAATVEAADPVTDLDGNTYPTVRIGVDRWMAANLRVSHFRNGDAIPEARTDEEWQRAAAEEQPAWCYYDADTTHAAAYGKLYNWYAVADPRGLGPEGWTVATTRAWYDLIAGLGGEQEAGGKLKSTSGWDGGGNGDGSSLFDGGPGGGRLPAGGFVDAGRAGIWWSSSEASPTTAWGYNLNHSAAGALRGSFDKGTGLSVRAVHCPTCVADSTTPLTFADRIQAILDASLASSLGVGLSAAVVLPDGQTIAAAAGASHDDVAITPDMPFAAGSIGKLFTAAAALQLAEEGQFGLDDPLHQWLPAYPYVDSTIAIRQLLNHTGGLGDFVDNAAYWDAVFAQPSAVWSIDGLLRAFGQPAAYAPGAGWNYSTTGYGLLRILIAELEGADLPDVYRERFWSPLGLDQSSVSLGDALPPGAAHGWLDLDGDGAYDDLSTWPRTAFASGIGGEFWATPGDLARWTRLLFHDRTILSASSLEDMLTFHAPCTGEEVVSAGYGLGVVLFNPELVRGEEAYGHGGNAPGYAAMCLYLPRLQVAIALMDNTEAGEAIGVCAGRMVEAVVGHLGD